MSKIKTVLVIGSNGQLGNEIRFLAKFHKRLNFIFTGKNDIDITRFDEVFQYFKSTKPEYCINCAAYTAVDMAEDETEKAYIINEKAVGNLASCCFDFNSTFYHISTDFVFDGTHYLPYTEEDVPNPLSVYGKSKLAGEIKAASINSKTVIIRTSWLYSTFGNNFVKTMLKLGSTKDELGVVFDQVGTPTYARELAKVLMEMIHAGYAADNPNRVLNFSNEGVASWYDFAHEIFTMKGIKIKLNPIHSYEYITKAVRPHYSVLDKKKIKNSLGLTIPHWKDSLKECLMEI